METPTEGRDPRRLQNAIISLSLGAHRVHDDAHAAIYAEGPTRWEMLRWLDVAIERLRLDVEEFEAAMKEEAG